MTSTLSISSMSFAEALPEGITDPTVQRAPLMRGSQKTSTARLIMHRPPVATAMRAAFRAAPHNGFWEPFAVIRDFRGRSGR
jgi:hypothetical protein